MVTVKRLKERLEAFNDKAELMINVHSDGMAIMRTVKNEVSVCTWADWNKPNSD